MGLEVIREVHRKKAEEREMRRKEVIDDVFNALKHCKIDQGSQMSVNR